MPVTNRYYGGSATGAGRIVQDFGLCNLKGQFIYTAKTRAKGLMVVTFFAPGNPASANVLKAIESFTSELEPAKWTPLAVAEGDRDSLQAYSDSLALAKTTVLMDHELYQTRTWGVSHVPSTFLIAGNGRTLARIVGDAPDQIALITETLRAEVNKIVAAEEAAKEAARKAEEEKKAAEAAAAAAAPAAAKA